MNAPGTIDTAFADLQQIVAHDELCQSGLTRDIAAALIMGWDVTSSLQRVDPPDRGVWVAPHPVVLRYLNITATGFIPVLHAGMSASQIEAAIWRQLRIFPDANPWRRKGVTGEAPRDPFMPHEEAVSEHTGKQDGRALLSETMRDEETRNPVIRSLLFAVPRDAADYLVAKLAAAPEVGRLLLAKNFDAALDMDKDLWSDDWPESVKQRCKQEGCFEPSSPPFAFLLALASLSRLGQNVSAHLMLAYDDCGRPLLIANLHLAALGCASGLKLQSVRKLFGHALLQTTALLPPDSVFEERNPELGETWSNAAAGVIAGVFATHGREAERPLTTPGSADDAKFVRDGILAHPALLPENQSQKHRFRRAPYATFYGTTSKSHAMVGALQIRSQLEQWMVPHKHGGYRKSDTEGRPFSRQQAAAALWYLWLETCRPEALQPELGCITRQPSYDGGCPQSPPPSIDELICGRNFGDTQAKEAERLLRILDQPQQPNYGAWYAPRLWIEDARDGFGFLSNGSPGALGCAGPSACRSGSFSKDLSRIDPSVLKRVRLGKGMRSARKARARSARVKPSFGCSPAMIYAERSAMTVSASATDQMWRLLLRQNLTGKTRV